MHKAPPKRSKSQVSALVLRGLTFWRFRKPREPNRHSWPLYLLSLLLFVALTSLLGILGYQFAQLRNQAQRMELTQGQRRAQRLARRIETVINNSQAIADKLAQELENGTLAKEDILQRLKVDAKKERKERKYNQRDYIFFFINI